jgi:hypothetical protein
MVGLLLTSNLTGETTGTADTARSLDTSRRFAARESVLELPVLMPTESPSLNNSPTNK